MKLTLDRIINSINEWRINVEFENRNYSNAEKIAKKTPELRNYLLNKYSQNNLNLLASDFYNHSC
jgi:flagellar basal body-associated protein FliL